MVKNFMVAHISNFLSVLRFPLAFLFLAHSPLVRFISILLGMITDCLDGFLARRYRSTSQLGAVLDPLADKFFVLFALIVFVSEERLSIPQAITLLCRDFSVLIFGLYLGLRGYWSSYQFRSIWAGKITTTLQFLVLLGLTFNYEVPSYVYSIFVILGFLALIELYFFNREVRSDLHIKKF